MLALQIALGIWLGGVLLFVTAITVSSIANIIKRNQRFGAPWWRIWCPA